MKLEGIKEALCAALRLADEDYLIGLCNKGTVNRAKKDLAAGIDPQVSVEGDTVSLHWEGTECVICAPLMESRCSCPSTSLCRHRVTAILWLRQQLESGTQDEDAPAAPPPQFEELRQYPIEKLYKQIGEKQLMALIVRSENGVSPKITESSVIKVELPWIPATVHLLEPLEHSTCTCHSREFCSHKAQALLYWKLQQKLLDLAALKEAVRTELPTPSTQEGRGICRAVQEMLSAQMSTGLSRMPNDVCDTVERMASRCHTGQIPNLERALRRLGKEYTAYYARSAQYRDTALLHGLAQSFRLAQALESADDYTYRTLVGSFRDEYFDVGELHLYFFGMRGFGGKNGAPSGSIYYFWECSKCRYYLFYQMNLSKNFSQRALKEGSTLWKLPCALEHMMYYTLDLRRAKATEAGRLSSTEQCSALLLELKKPWEVFPQEEIFTDFNKLLLERSAPHLPELKRLALVRPKECIVQEYDTIRQVYSICLLDEEGRSLWVEVRYQDRAAKVTEWLERTAQKIQKSPDLRPVFFGTVYREEDKIKLFPIEIFTDWEGTV